MQLAILSDIHSNLHSLKIIIDDALSKGISKFIFLGDYVSDGFHDNEIISLVEQYGTHIIQGNREEMYLELNSHKKEIISGEKNNYENIKTLQYTINNLSVESYTFIKTMPIEKKITINNYKILLTHGHKYENIEELTDKYDLVLSGHTHIYQDFKIAKTRFINPGSVGLPCDTPSYKYGILTIDENINFELREFPTADTYQELKKEYVNSSYYQENAEYGKLVLLEIRDGFPYVTDFILRIRSFKVRDLNSYNRLWHEQFTIYYDKIKKEEDNII